MSLSVPTNGELRNSLGDNEHLITLFVLLFTFSTSLQQNGIGDFVSSTPFTGTLNLGSITDIIVEDGVIVGFF